MSYDIELLPAATGQDWDEAIRAAQESEDRPLDAAERRRNRDQFDRIVERMRAVLGEVEVAAPEDGTARFYGEVSHLETGLQVMVFAGSGAVTFAYWEHEDREAFHHKVAQVVQIACQETGWRAYDPQTDEAFDGTFDDEPGLAGVSQIRAEQDGRAPGADQRPSGSAPRVRGVAPPRHPRRPATRGENAPCATSSSASSSPPLPCCSC